MVSVTFYSAEGRCLPLGVFDLATVFDNRVLARRRGRDYVLATRNAYARWEPCGLEGDCENWSTLAVAPAPEVFAVDADDADDEFFDWTDDLPEPDGDDLRATGP